MSSSCCPTDKPRISSDYKPKHMATYDAGDYKAKTAIIVVTDVFGFSPQAKQVCDILSQSTGARVIALDFFQGEGWPSHTVFDGIVDWLKASYSYEVLKPFIVDLIEKLKYQGVTTFYGLGFCWGGLLTYKLAQDGLISKMGTAHPSFYSPEETKVPCPFAILPSQNEAPLLELKEAIEKSEFASQSVFERFDNMHHGWCAARADFSNPENKKEAERALEILAKFFNQ